MSGGIELDSWGAPTAYYFSNRHPGSIQNFDTGHKRIPAFGRKSGRRNVLHLYDRERPGQRWGVPYLAPVIESLSFSSPLGGNHCRESQPTQPSLRQVRFNYPPDYRDGPRYSPCAFDQASHGILFSESSSLEAWKFFRMRRSWLADGFWQPVYEECLSEGVNKGRITAPGFFTDAEL